jgi:hypothetical protein
MLAALHLLLHSDRLFIGPKSERLPAILEASRRYQNEVSNLLAGQVLCALNELVRGFQEADLIDIGCRITLLMRRTFARSKHKGTSKRFYGIYMYLYALLIH